MANHEIRPYGAHEPLREVDRRGIRDDEDELQIIREMGFEAMSIGALWFCTIPEATSRLIAYWHDPAIGFELIEITEGPKGEQSARIYASPRPDMVPTIVLGGIAAISKVAWWDRRPMVPLNGKAMLLLDGGLRVTYPDDIQDLPGIRGVLDSNQRLFGVVRPSSFMLERVDQRVLADANVRIHTYVNHVSTKAEFFSILSPPDESGVLVGNTHRLLVTNSEVYMGRHPEWDFRRVTREEVR